MCTPQSLNLARFSGLKTMSQLSIHGVKPEDLLHLGDVVADARRAPHVVGGVDIAGIVGRKMLGHHRPCVGEVPQLRLVELLEDVGLDLALQEVGRGHHDVIAGLAGHQARLQRLVGVEGVVDHLDAGLPGEVLEDVRRHVVGPVVQVDDPLLGGRWRGQNISTAAARPRRNPERPIVVISIYLLRPRTASDSRSSAVSRVASFLAKQKRTTEVTGSCS